MAKRTIADTTNDLAKAIANLSDVLDALRAPTVRGDVSIYQDAAVKRFEIAYELLIKLMFVVVKQQSEPEASILDLSFGDAHRSWLAMGFGLASSADYSSWRAARNVSIHTYRPVVYFDKIEPLLDGFVAELRYVRDRLGNLPT